MKGDAVARLMILKTYVLLSSLADFTAANSGLAARMEAEGERDVQSNRFCIGTSTARVVINNRGPAAWNGQHAISMDWPDIAALDRVARLIDVTLLGPVTPEIVKWLANSG